ncbi:hypothetical protein SDJN02_01750, partial [Cucurbita argyrosperma subsp. argyrosperma]
MFFCSVHHEIHVLEFESQWVSNISVEVVNKDVAIASTSFVSGRLSAITVHNRGVVLNCPEEVGLFLCSNWLVLRLFNKIFVFPLDLYSSNGEIYPVSKRKQVMKTFVGQP